jgi:hypothetical protein
MLVHVVERITGGGADAGLKNVDEQFYSRPKPKRLRYKPTA